MGSGPPPPSPPPPPAVSSAATPVPAPSSSGPTGMRLRAGDTVGGLIGQVMQEQSAPGFTSGLSGPGQLGQSTILGGSPTGVRR
jgi:hypothetical protein